jgi:hypothetical protein
MGLVFTVTSGRSGTKLLTVLLQKSLGMDAEHEPEPRANFELRSTIENPEHGLNWLVNEKLPFIASHHTRGSYAETSHIYCKGFVELILQLGLKTRFIILKRDAKAVARSLFRMSCIPQRTDAGRTVLIGPSDGGVLSLPEWHKYSDYQLCYWYAREIERRQDHYATLFKTLGIPSYDLHMHDLLDWAKFTRLCAFVDADNRLGSPDFEQFRIVTAANQNPRNVAHEGNVDAILPHDVEQQEDAIDFVLSLSQ